MAVQVRGWPGVAFNVLGPELVEAEVDLEDLDGDLEDQLDQLLEVELVPHEHNVRVVMVGDDKVHIVDKDDITELAEEDYCSVCGQIGCMHDGRE